MPIHVVTQPDGSAHYYQWDGTDGPRLTDLEGRMEELRIEREIREAEWDARIERIGER